MHELLYGERVCSIICFFNEFVEPSSIYDPHMICCSWECKSQRRVIFSMWVIRCFHAWLSKTCMIVYYCYLCWTEVWNCFVGPLDNTVWIWQFFIQIHFTGFARIQLLLWVRWPFAWRWRGQRFCRSRTFCRCEGFHTRSVFLCQLMAEDVLKCFHHFLLLLLFASSQASHPSSMWLWLRWHHMGCQPPIVISPVAWEIAPPLRFCNSKTNGHGDVLELLNSVLETDLNLWWCE